MHERMSRATNLWLREVGRRDPIIPDDYWSGGENAMGDFGLIETAQRERDNIDRRWREAYSRTHHLRPDRLRRRRHELDEKRRTETREFGEKLKGLRPDVYRHVKFHRDRIVYHDGANSVELARMIGGRRNLDLSKRSKKKGEFPATMLLNGDGFDNPMMQQIQAELRDRVQRAFGQRQVMVIPFVPLAAAGIKIETIKRIEAARDSNETVRVDIRPLSLEVMERLRKQALDETPINLENPTRWRVSKTYEEDTPNGRVQFEASGHETLNHENWRIWYQPEHGVPGFHSVFNPRPGQNPFVQVNVHRLGAAVFSAVGPDGKRHRYLSAFDTNETPPMYFLAQLPDEGTCHSYDHAISLLAPPIVHESRAKGKRIYRQGDVFFIQTDLTDQAIRKQGGTIHEGVYKKTGLPFRTRNIYGTGHIASRVARLKNGVTLACGLAEHFPALTEPEREPEHRAINLEGAVWFLCVRNTVPRSANQDSATRRDTTRRRRTNARSTATA